MRTESIGSASPTKAPTHASTAGSGPDSSFRARLADARAGSSTKRATDGIGGAYAPASLGPVGGARVRAGERAKPSHLDDDVTTPPGARSGPRRRDENDGASMEPARFAALPAVLSPPSTGAPASIAGGGAAPAELAALVERFLTSFRVGRLADGSAVLRLRVDGRGRGDVDVELRGTAGGLVVVVDASDGDRRRASEWAERLEAALRARGLDVGAVEVG